MGKTRILAEYQNYLTSRDIRPIIGHCYTYKKNIQYWVLQDMLHSYFNAGKSDNPKQFEKQILLKLNQLVPTEIDSYMLVLDRLFGTGFTRVKKLRANETIDPVQMQSQIFWTIRDLFRKIIQKACRLNL